MHIILKLNFEQYETKEKKNSNTILRVKIKYLSLNINYV